jgi:putative methylase
LGRNVERIIPRRELEEALRALRPHPHPDPELEQYTTPPRVAAELLFTARYIYDDIEGKLIADLGCGTGRLGIGALILGGWGVVGVDIDPTAISVARENADEAGVSDRLHLVVGDITLLRPIFDTVVMNPPFGTRRRHADVEFLDEALRLAGAVYTIHKSSTRDFILKYIENRGGRISALFSMEMEIPHIFHFHRKPKKLIEVDLYRAESPKGLNAGGEN